MATTVIRFRPVVFGKPPGDGMLYYLIEEADGQVRFRDQEILWPVAVPLELVTVQHLPEYYTSRGFPIQILPVQAATGATRTEAFQQMLSTLEGLAGRGTKRRIA